MISPTLKPQFKLHICNTIFKKTQLNKILFNKLVFMMTPTLKPQFKLYICNTIFKEDNNCM
jgi:hypothetical protein